MGYGTSGPHVIFFCQLLTPTRKLLPLSSNPFSVVIDCLLFDIWAKLHIKSIVVTAGWHVLESAQRLDMFCVHFFQTATLNQPFLLFTATSHLPTHPCVLAAPSILPVLCHGGRECMAWDSMNGMGGKQTNKNKAQL